MNGELRMLTLNVASPSVRRAEQQLEWLAARDEHVFVLTELSAGKGSAVLAESLHQAGWDVSFMTPEGGERGVLAAARVRSESASSEIGALPLPHRVAIARLAGDVDVLGVYAPSRDESVRGIERKQRFLAALTAELAHRAALRPAVLIGDLNILESAHRPRHGSFRDWEYAFHDDLIASGWADAYRLRHPDAMDYSWIGHHGDGYRFDHALVTVGLAARVTRCDYVHETRELGLSDHSALTLSLASVGAERLDVSASLSPGPASLF